MRAGIATWIFVFAAMAAVRSSAGVIFEDDFESNGLGSAPADWILNASPTTFTVEGDSQSSMGDAGDDRGMHLDNDTNTTFEAMSRTFTAQVGTFYLQFDYYAFDKAELHNLQIGDGVFGNNIPGRGVNFTMSTVSGVSTGNWYRFTLTIDVAADTYDWRVQSLDDSSLDTTTTHLAFDNAQAELDTLKFWFNTGSQGGGEYALDNILLTDVPLPGGPITWSGVGVSNITTETATAYATLGGTNAEVTLYWKQGGSAPTQHTGWDGTNNTPSGLVSTGQVERAMSDLQADTLYSFIFYATSSTLAAEAWSAAGSVSTPLTSAQTPVFTSAAAGPGSVTLGWTDNASNETAYVLQRAEGAGPYSVIDDALSADTVTYVDSGLAIGTYSYRLAATNAGNGSATAFTACETNAVVATAAPPSLLFYEGFDYADATSLHGQGGWTNDPNATSDVAAGNSGSDDPFDIFDGTGIGAGPSGETGEIWDGSFTSGAGGLTLVRTGNFAGYLGGHMFATQFLDPGVTSTFTDGSTTWVSFLSYRGNRGLNIAIGAGPTTSDRGQQSADPLLGFGHTFNSNQARALRWPGSSSSYDQTATALGSNRPVLLVAKIVWGATDTITVVAFVDGADITEAAFDAATQSTQSGTFTQSDFDVISLSNAQGYIDELRIALTFEDVVTGLPAAPVAPPGAITWSDAGVTNIMADAATATATLGGTNAEVTLYWKKGSSAPQQFTGWDGTNSSPAGLIATGLVQRAMTGLDADTLYSCIFYGTNSAAISNAWSAAVQLSTALTAAQTPVFTSAVAGPGSITLGWTDNASNETAYILQRAAGAGPYSVVTDALSPSTATYVDGGLAPGAYSYRLAATNAGNGSATAFTACETNAVVTEAGKTGLLFYEGFDYGTGALNGTNGWSASNFNIAGNTTQGAGWDNTNFIGVAQTGLFAGGNNAEGNIALDPSVTATFAYGATTWLSWIAISVDSRWSVVAIGKGTFADRAQNASAGGQDIGGGSIFNSGAANPSIWNTGHALGPAITIPASSLPARFMVAKIEWDAGGADDTVTLAAFASGDTITEAAFDAKVTAGTATSLAADLDQSTFEDLNIATSRNNFLDEIRIATTFKAAVTGLPPVPPVGMVLIIR